MWPESNLETRILVTRKTHTLIWIKIGGKSRLVSVFEQPSYGRFPWFLIFYDPIFGACFSSKSPLQSGFFLPQNVCSKTDQNFIEQLTCEFYVWAIFQSLSNSSRWHLLSRYAARRCRSVMLFADTGLCCNAAITINSCRSCDFVRFLLVFVVVVVLLLFLLLLLFAVVVRCQLKLSFSAFVVVRVNRNFVVVVGV